MVQDIRLTPQVRQVLTTLIDNPLRQMSGSDIARETGLASGSLYPILFRLENTGWLTSEWEAEEPAALGRPRRRFYRITAQGVRSARRIAEQFTPPSGGLSWV